MKEEKKLSVKDEIRAWVGAIGLIAGMFGFGLILGIIFMDYDPRTMLEGIAEDLKAIFGGFRW